MFHWIAKIIISTSIFLGITSPAVSPIPIVVLTPIPTAIVSASATPKLVSKQIIKFQIPIPSTITTSIPTLTPTPISTPTSTYDCNKISNLSRRVVAGREMQIEEAIEYYKQYPPTAEGVLESTKNQYALYLEAKQKCPMSTPVATPTPVGYTETQTIARDFLNNPILDSLKTFCEKAKNISSSQTKEVLNEDKTAIKMVNIPLSETISSCAYLSDSNSDIVFISPSPSSLLIDLCATDTDTLRMTKIKWNDKIRGYNQTYKLYGSKNNSLLSFTVANVNYELIPSCPVERTSKIVDGIVYYSITPSVLLELYPSRVSTFININNSIVVPEVEIRKLIK